MQRTAPHSAAAAHQPAKKPQHPQRSTTTTTAATTDATATDTSPQAHAKSAQSQAQPEPGVSGQTSSGSEPARLQAPAQPAPSLFLAPPEPVSAGSYPPRGFVLDFNAITARHYRRLLNGALLAQSPKIDWATLMCRTFRGLDVLECPSCGGRLFPVATITRPTIIGAILDHIAEKIATSPTARARAPTGDGASHALH